MGLHAEALAEVSQPTEGETDDDRGEHASLASFAAAKLGRFNEARHFQANAREFLAHTTAWSIRAELRFFEAAFHCMMGDIEASARIVARAESDITGYYERQDHDVVSVNSGLAGLLNIFCVVEQARGRYQSGIESVTRALHLSTNDPTQDVGLIAMICANLSGIADSRSVDEEVRTMQLVRTAYENIEWPEELSRHRFYIHRELALLASNTGDFVTAFRE